MGYQSVVHHQEKTLYIFIAFIVLSYIYIHSIYCAVFLNTQKGLLKVNASSIVLYNIVPLPTKHVVLPAGFVSVLSRKVLQKDLKQKKPLRGKEIFGVLSYYV